MGDTCFSYQGHPTHGTLNECARSQITNPPTTAGYVTTAVTFWAEKAQIKAFTKAGRSRIRATQTIERESFVLDLTTKAPHWFQKGRDEGHSPRRPAPVNLLSDHNLRVPPTKRVKIYHMSNGEFNCNNESFKRGKVLFIFPDLVKLIQHFIASICLQWAHCIC